ncbi:glucose-6-phosphate isomerase [Pelagibacteraceae bacterium GOM-A4]|nr:glucose-6-phosphate isomerase [Pelagibacteraceae bacterium GOM-A4]
MKLKNINYINFNNQKKTNKNKKLIKLLKLKDLISKYPMLKSFTQDYKYTFKKSLLKKYKNYSEYNLIGIGGSSLGSEAIYQFLNDKIKKKFYFFDNLEIKKNLKTQKKRLNIIISKSGNTLETISNLNIILTKQNKNQNLLITEKKKNILNILANKIKSDIIEHRNYIGGRYSVLSEVGMIPAELMGLKERKFKRLNYLIKKKSFINFLIKNVLSIHNNILNNKTNSVILNYDPRSENFLKWYQQLVGESLGKSGKGLFPIISKMPKDNHSLLQLYLDGPKNNFYTFFSAKDVKSFKYNKLFLVNELTNLKNKNIGEVLQAQKKATQIVFRKKKLAFRSIEILNRNEETLGELFSFFVLETLLLGILLKVNPLDQQSVELIKIETKKLLK